MKLKLFIYLGFVSIVYGAYLKNIPITLHQPDGSYFSCFTTGDEYYIRIHNKENYTIIQNDTDGFYYYAKQQKNKIIPSNFRADKPISNSMDIKSGIHINKDEYLIRKKNKSNGRGRDAPTTGIINNINIFIRFADEEEFNTPRYEMDEPFNKPDGPSLSHYFNEVSYSQVEIITHHFPQCDMSTNLSYQDQYPRSYYQPYNAQTNPNGYSENNSAIREQTMLKNAIEFINSEIPIELDVDGNNDGYVDNVTFLISGSPDGWSDLLWPHRWSLYLHTVYINGAIVDAYNLNLATGGYFTVGTLCHEFFHSMGAPDLYHYNNTGSPIAVGGWDVMDASADIPQYMSAWMKHKYGNWIECPVIHELGIYPLLPLQFQETSCYRINSPNSFNEFFIVEYRKKIGLYEINTPGYDSGLLVYRITDNLNGNANGPPDEVYLYRPGGTSTDNGNLINAIFSAETNRIEINDSTDPSSFLYGGSPGGLNIQNIGYPEEIIEFTYWNIFIQTDIVNIYNDNDDDGILNPSETANLSISANILSAPSNAQNVIGTLTSNLEWVNFSPSEIYFGNLPANGNAIILETQITLDETNILTPATFTLSIEADFADNSNIISYYDNFDYAIDISLNQVGFPISTNEIRSNPLIIDLNNDGENEIIFGDYNGYVHILNKDASEYISNTFPFNSGDQIWGSPAASDFDLDEYMDFVITSKSKHLYIFDYFGIKLDFQTDLYLIGTPSIGNLDNNPDLEIVFSGYSPNNKLFVIKLDGSSLNGFPIELGEKTKASAALADFNENGKDDIVIGTDNNNIYLFYDDGSLAPGFPFTAEDKFQSAPTIIDVNGEKIIFAGNNDNYLYAINTDGSLRFSILTGDKVNTSPSFIEYNGMPYITFGSKDNFIYIVDFNGSFFPGTPFMLDGNIEGGIISSDIDNDSELEIIATTDSGSIYVINKDGTYYKYFPIYNHLPFTSAPLIQDLDNDGDLEIFCGSVNKLSVIDIKELGSNNNSWNMFQGNNLRTGYYFYSIESDCSVEIGNVNGDFETNILDLVQIANYILGINILQYECAADFNLDETINIIDLVLIADYILNH